MGLDFGRWEGPVAKVWVLQLGGSGAKIELEGSKKSTWIHENKAIHPDDEQLYVKSNNYIVINKSKKRWAGWIINDVKPCHPSHRLGHLTAWCKHQWTRWLSSSAATTPNRIVKTDYSFFSRSEAQRAAPTKFVYELASEPKGIVSSMNAAAPKLSKRVSQQSIRSTDVELNIKVYVPHIRRPMTFNPLVFLLRVPTF